MTWPKDKVAFKFFHTLFWFFLRPGYLTIIIIPRARIGSESIVHEAEGQMGYWLRGQEGERNNIVLVKSNQLVKNIETKQLKLVKARL